MAADEAQTKQAAEAAAEAQGAEAAATQAPASGSAGAGWLAASELPASMVRVALGALILGGMTTGVFFLVTDVIGPGLGPAQSIGATISSEAISQAQPPGLPGAQYAIEEMVINPAGTHGKRFLRLGVALETDGGPEVLGELDTRKAQVRDLFISEFSTRTLDELTDPTVREELRIACIDKINGFLVAGDISSLYFTDYVLQ